ncbi:MAG: hypothetical protein ACKO00_06180 [Crocinitomicaceae bacterium]
MIDFCKTTNPFMDIISIVLIFSVDDTVNLLLAGLGKTSKSITFSTIPILGHASQLPKQTAGKVASDETT